MAQLLKEYVDSRDVSLGVDRELGVLRGVKLIGLESRNGRRYRESALAAAASLYEEAKVNVNHPKEGPLTPRDYQDRLGVIRGVQLRSGAGLFGDLHFNPKHALAEQLLWDAEHNPHNVGFSHNVLARLTREREQTVVEEITKVQSVDLVADPATTQGLFEQADQQRSTPPASKPPWDALTREVLELHRPDLLAELQAAHAEQLQHQLEEAVAKLDRAAREQRIFACLCEHRLSLQSAGTSVNHAPDQVSSKFVESLLHVAEADVEALIAERAELARVAMAEKRAAATFQPPFSREQTLFSVRGSAELATAAEFATALKSSLN